MVQAAQAPTQLPTRHGEKFVHLFNSETAQAFALSVWHDVHGFGILYFSVISGVTNWNV